MSDFLPALLIVGAIVLLFPVSLALVIRWLNSTDVLTRSALQRRAEAIDTAWRQVLRYWGKAQRGAALRSALLELWRAYAAYKRASLPGYIDLAVLRLLCVALMAAVTINVWTVIYFLLQRAFP